MLPPAAGGGRRRVGAVAPTPGSSRRPSSSIDSGGCWSSSCPSRWPQTGSRRWPDADGAIVQECLMSNARPLASPRLIVGQDRHGRWVVQDRLGLCGGWFVDRAEAIPYAKFQTGGAPRAVLLAPGVVEPDLSLDDEDGRRARSPNAA